MSFELNRKISTKREPLLTAMNIDPVTAGIIRGAFETTCFEAEMLFTGRPFTAKEMADCGFVNSVVTLDKLEAETQKYASACSRSRPTDVAQAQKTFLELYKQYNGEYFGSLLTGFVEGMLPIMKNDSATDVQLGGDVFSNRGLNNVVKDIDMDYPPEWRLGRGNRMKP